MSVEAWFYAVWWVGMVVVFIGISDALSGFLDDLAERVLKGDGHDHDV